MKKHPVEDGALWMTRAIDPRHSREEYPENRPDECVGPFFPGNDWMETDSIDQESSTEVGQKNIAVTTPVDSILHF